MMQKFEEIAAALIISAVPLFFLVLGILHDIEEKKK